MTHYIVRRFAPALLVLSTLAAPVMRPCSATFQVG